MCLLGGKMLARKRVQKCAEMLLSLARNLMTDKRFWEEGDIVQMEGVSNAYVHK